MNIPIKNKDNQKIVSSSRLKLDIKQIILLIILILLSIFFVDIRKILLFVFFSILTGYITYYSKLYHLPIDVSPLFFLEIAITRYYGIRWTLLFIFISYIIPKAIAGSAANWMSYAFISVSLIANIASMFMVDLSLQSVGYLTSVIQYIGGIFITMTMKPFYFAAADGVANVTNNMLWFLIFSGLIEFIF